MTVTCRLRVLLAQLNVERAKNGEAPISLRHIARESGISQSVLVSLHTGRSQRIDYATIDRLLAYFHAYFPVRIDDLFTWQADQQARVPAAIMM
jgi:hypothetical protein